MEDKTYKLAARVSAIWLFPGLLTSMVLGNQPWLAAQIAGQLAGWLCIAAATYVLAAKSKLKIWVFSLLVCIIGAKFLRIASDSSWAETAYICLINTLYCFAGAAVIYTRRELVYKQVLVVCFINLIVMILQVAGAGAWTQLLTTHGEGNLTAPAKTLFVTEDTLDYLLVQGRPAGILYSNIILALIILFGIALHFTQNRPNFWKWTTTLCAITVLCMSKAVFVGFSLTVIWMLVMGHRRQKILVLKSTVLVAVFLKLYAVFFPGLMAVNLGIQTITTSFYLRANDIVAGLNQDSPLKDMEIPLAGTPRASWADEGEHVSGYTVLLQGNSLVLVASLLLTGAILYQAGLCRLRRMQPPGSAFRESKHRMIIVFILLAAYPFSFPAWTIPVYWYMMGLGLLPLVALLRPQFLVPMESTGGIAAEVLAEQEKLGV